MTTPVSIRFDQALLDRLRSRAQATPGASVSGLVQTMVDEGLKSLDHPDIFFNPGPSGRRAVVRHGPDVWEIIKFLREIDERGDAAVDAAMEMLALSRAQIDAAIR